MARLGDGLFKKKCAADSTGCLALRYEHKKLVVNRRRLTIHRPEQHQHRDKLPRYIIVLEELGPARAPRFRADIHHGRTGQMLHAF